MQVGGYYAVEPKRNCPHVKQITISDKLKRLTLEQAQEYFASPCQHCDVKDENWICFPCGALECSRYKNGHMVAHNESSNHEIAMSLADLSIWCYECSSYIVSPIIRPIHTMLYMAKFGKLPPSLSTVDIDPPKSNSTYPDPKPIHNDLPEDINNPKATGHLSKESIQEYQDEENVLQAKIEELATLVKESKKIIFFTGAGVSTSANIPDYRGPNGVWTKRDRGIKSSLSCNIGDASPTICHKGIKSICDMEDKECFVVSTNVDGLHMKSGLTEDQLFELHGNCYQEVCCVCGKKETRDFLVKSKRSGVNVDDLKGKKYDESRISHATGRKCDCGGFYCDNIIAFGENLPPKEIKLSVDKASEADLSLVLGTSMKVSPANQLPSLALQNGGKLVIVNLQHTPFDDQCAVRIYATSDEVFQRLSEKVGFSVKE